ncbi:MAG: sugar phosphate isomerase/epimerase [Verrucomicrobiae bacterium]|nr:sugar phosphate isomerase/epimerase [Verrucomicrobiae bacterium]NNJ43922.1 sugar phosphate isomerase/epimerase [Akkermansiaceae bacterium]
MKCIIPLLSVLTVAISSALGGSALDKKDHPLGVCDWSIGKTQNPEAFDFAEKLGFDGVQVSFNGGAFDLRDKMVRDQFRAKVKETGVGMASLAMGCLNGVPYSSDPNAEKWVSEVLDVMILMEKEAKLIEDQQLADRVRPKIVLLAFFGKGDIKNKPDLTAEVIRRLKKVAPKAEKHGLTLGLETWLSADELLKILQAVDSPAVKVYYDVANAHKMGYDIDQEIKKLGTDHICQIHFKEHGVVLGNGEIDFLRLKKRIDSIGYKGWIIAEKATDKKLGIEKSFQLNQQFMRHLFYGKPSHR